MLHEHYILIVYLLYIYYILFKNSFSGNEIIKLINYIFIITLKHKEKLFK